MTKNLRLLGRHEKNQRPPRLPGSTTMKARRPSHYSTVSDASRMAGMEIIDSERERNLTDQLDTIIVLAALFVGFLSAFLIELLNRLEEDPMDIIQNVLIHQTQMMRNSSLGPYVPADFSPPEYIVIVNALLYASLGAMLLAVFIAMLIKRWMREFHRHLRTISIPEQRAKTHEFRYLGMIHWKLPEIVEMLPALLEISLFLFSIALMLFLFHSSKPSFLIITVIIGVGVLFYAITASISTFATSAPFTSPLSRTLSAMYRHVHTYFCPDIHDFLLPRFDTTPATALGRLRLGITIFLSKWRPYDERDFVNPIRATTMDEVQLHTAASALQRTHDSAPNSQHSETLQWSVWQIASSPTPRIPPLFDLPYWIYDRVDDQEYLMRLPPDKVVALVATSLRVGDSWVINRLSAAKSVLRPMSLSESPWDRLVYGVFNLALADHADMVEEKSDDLISMLQSNELSGEEIIWLLNTLLDLRSHTALSTGYLKICLEILSCQAPKWSYETPAHIVLLEAVVAFALISSSSNRTYQRTILNNSRQHPWLLLNLRNPEPIRNMVESARDSHRKQLISMLFLVLYALMWGRSEDFAAQYFETITEMGDLCLYTSALTANAPAIGDIGLSTIGRMLVAPRTQSLTSIIVDSIRREECYVQKELLKNYDDQLGASEDPDPNIVAIVLLLSKQLPSSVVDQLHDLDLTLKHPWLKRAARVIARLDIPDESSMDLGPFHDHKVHNMIAAMSLRRYVAAKPIQHSEYLLLASFLGSRELAVSALALVCYMQTILSDSNSPSPPPHFDRAVRAVFNLLLPGHQLQMGWKPLEMFVNEFEKLSVEWRRTFAAAFFTPSRQPLKKLRDDRDIIRDDRDIITAGSELERILTWDYFHEEERAFEFTDSRLSGLDWMVIAWSLHLSQQGWVAPMVNEGFVLCALYKLLDAAPHHQIIPIIPKLREFVQWFEHAEPSEYRSRVGAQIEDIDRHQKLHVP